MVGAISVRLEDGLHERLKQRVGERSVTAFVVEAIEAALGEAKPVEEVAGPPVRLGAVVREEVVKPRDEAKVERIKAYIRDFPVATAEGQPEEMKGYLCGSPTAGGQCSKPAFRWEKNQARCEQH
jgi:hypothetical protein